MSLAPRRLWIDIPVARHKGSMGWSDSHRTQLTYEDSSGVLHVHRQVRSASDAHDWTTAAEAFAHFDDQLASAAGCRRALAFTMRVLRKAASLARTITSNTIGRGISGTGHI
jgi:DNA-binding GntR family transcriptional regulator